MDGRGTIALVLVACGRLGYEPVRGATDGAGVPDTAAADTATAVDARPFGMPVPIVELNTPGDDDDPTLTADLLEICLSSTRGGGVGGQDVWCAGRSDPGATWGTPANVAIVNTTVDETTPELSADGLTMYFSRGPPGGNYEIYATTRASRGASWSTPMLVPELSSPAYDAGPAPVSDVALYVQSERTGNRDLFLARRSSAADPWSTPEPIAELNTADFESDAFGNSALTVIYFARDPVDATMRQIYRATRSDPSQPFGASVLVEGVNSDSFEGDPWVPADESFIVFTSGRGGTEDIYIAWR